MADSITQQQLAQAIARQVANSSGESIGLKTLRRDLEEEFGLAKRALDNRRDEIKELLLAAMNQVDEPRGRTRTGAQSSSAGGSGGGGAPSARAPAETIMAWEEEPEEAKGKNRAGQKPDFEGFLKKRGDTGRIKLWQKRHFRLFKDEGVIAYFKNDKETVQLGEISVVGAFLIEKRDDVAKFAFTITMKTTARIWWLQGKDEAQRQSWMDACQPLMKEDIGGVEKKRKKPPLGEPLRFPPTYVQGWTEIEQSKSVLQASKHWAGLLPKAPAQVELADGQVAITIKASEMAAIEEVRHVQLDDGKEGWIQNLPKQLKYSADSVQWSAGDSQLSQAKFFYDNKTQEELLKRLVGQEIEVSNTTKNRFGDGVTFKGKVAYVSEDRKEGLRTDMTREDWGHQYALVDDSANTVHFLNTKDAHSFNLLGVDAKSLSPGSDEVFAAPRLWGKFHSEASETLGQLTYQLDDAFTVDPNYVVTLNANETIADVQGWFNIENKTSRTYENARVFVIPGKPKAPPVIGKDGKKEASLAENAEEAAKDEAASAAKAKVPGLGALASLIPKKAEPKPPAPKEYHYPVVEAVTLPAYEWAHAAFLHQPISSRTQHLIRFDTPKYTVKPVTAKETGQDAKVLANTVVIFKNPLDVEIPAGLARVQRRDASNHGVRPLATVSLPRVHAGERVILNLEEIEGVTVTRTQTGFNFDAEKRFIIESYEIAIANGRQELIHLSIEESMWRWNTFEITNSWPQYKVTPHPRIIRWVTSLNHGEDIKIRYTVFYNAFELDGDWADDEEEGAAEAN